MATAMALIMVGCGPGRPEVPTATVPQAPPTPVGITAVITAPDPFAVPAVIDEAYVNRVLVALNAAAGDAVRLMLRERAVTPEVLAKLDTIYIDPEARALARDAFAIDQSDGFVDYVPLPGDSVSTVTNLISASATCIFAQATRDGTKVGKKARGNLNLWVALRPQPRRENVSGWGFIYEGFQDDYGPPLDPCVVH